MPVLTVPRGIGDLTGEWLAAALADRADGAQVTSLVAVQIASGTGADSVRLVPTWDRPTPGPASVVAKVPSSDQVNRLIGFATKAFGREAAFYNELAATVWVSRPTCYFAHYDHQLDAYVVLLEDMLPADPGDPVDRLLTPGGGVGHARTGRPARPALGRRFAARRRLARMPRFGRGPGPRRTGPEPVRRICGPLWGPPRAAKPSGSSEQLMGALDRYLTDRPGPWTVLHGDLRLDNLLFGRPRVTVVDWHTVRVGPALSDVSYFIGSALPPEARRDHECELVRAYHRHLAAAGVTLSWEACWEGYRRYSLDGLVTAIASSMLDRQSETSDDAWMTMVNRHGCQALDLGAEEFLAG